MYKEYIVNGHQNSPAAQQATATIDLMTVTGYIRTPNQNHTTVCGPGYNYSLYMTEAEYDEFKTHVKTANRLKRGYE